MYTDRPMYRPGQTVYFRGLARQVFNGRYELPQANEVPLILRDANGVQLLSLNVPLSPFGTFNGEFKLSDSAVPGGSIISARSMCPLRSKSNCCPWSPGSIRITHFG